ncbi:MAG: hypothetical protein ACT4R6_12740 [Gemmatimonadaceae bacterium]
MSPRWRHDSPACGRCCKNHLSSRRLTGMSPASTTLRSRPYCLALFPVESLSAVVPSVPSKTTLPVQANVLLESTDSGLRLSATDLDTAVSQEFRRPETTIALMPISAPRSAGVRS